MSEEASLESSKKGTVTLAIVEKSVWEMIRIFTTCI
jgi:hypothetical protein